MAREGINKQLVQKAKTALLAQGKRPTIDAVRVALGNTGSKTTISHYLKELEEKPKATLERLTEPLAHLVLTLSAQLRVEVEEQLIEAQAQFTQEKIQLEAQLKIALQLVDEQQDKLDKLEAKLLNAQQQCQEKKTQLHQQSSELTLAQRHIEELTRLLREPHETIVILGNELQHTREALEQFRQARPKTHAAVIQLHAQHAIQLSGELKRTCDQLSIVQKELMELHRENARLLQILGTQHSTEHN